MNLAINKSAQDCQYSRDHDLKKELLDQPLIQTAVKKIKSMFSGYGMSHTRNLYANSVKLHPELNAEIFEVIDHCKKALNFEGDLKVFVSQSPYMNGYCFKDGTGSYVIGLTSKIFEYFDKNELCFVIGHELGHVIYEHFELPMPITSQFTMNGKRVFDLKTILNLFTWSRAAEISADRAGLLCCANILDAVNALYKLSSGLKNKITLMQAQQFLGQLDAFVLNPSAGRHVGTFDKSLDCFQTHPFSPLRVKALFNYHDSEAFGEGSRSLSEVDKLVSQDLSLMDPSYLEKDDTGSKLLRYLLLYAGYSLLQVDGSMGEHEKSFLVSLVSEKEYKVVESETEDFITKRLGSLVDDINKSAATEDKARLLIHLVLLASKDKEFSESEISFLESLCESLDITPLLIEDTIQSIKSSLD